MAAAVVSAALGAPYFGGVALAEQAQRGLDPPRLARDLAPADRVGAPGGGYVSVRRAPVRPEPGNGVRSRDAEVDLQTFVEAGLGVGGERADPTSREGENEPGEVEPLAAGPHPYRAHGQSPSVWEGGDQPGHIRGYLGKHCLDPGEARDVGEKGGFAEGRRSGPGTE